MAHCSSDFEMTGAFWALVFFEELAQVVILPLLGLVCLSWAGLT
jgi:hypothetical protein